MGICDRIALAVDFSEPSKIAARAAFELVKRVGEDQLAMIHAVRSVVFPAGSQPAVRARLESLRDRIRRAADEQLERLCEELGAPEGLAIEHRIVEGHPAETIPKAVEEMQATLLLVGSHARRGVRRWIAGSIAEHMLERARVPTLVLLTGEDDVPPDAELADLKKVLIAIDEGPHSVETARAGLALARSFSARPDVVLLHVVEPTGIEVLAADDPDVAAYQQMLEEEGRRAAEAIVRAADPRELNVEVRIGRGRAEEVILETASALEARLVVVGARGIGRPGSASIGSTSTHVVRHSNVPVLVVPEREA